MPDRVQMHRRKGGWRDDHPDAVIVARPGPWGNPFRFGDPGVPDAVTAVALFEAAILLTHWAEAHGRLDENMLLAGIMANMPGPIPRVEAIRTHLRGRDLACWCPLDAPCHADVLLEVANDTPS